MVYTNAIGEGKWVGFSFKQNTGMNGEHFDCNAIKLLFFNSSVLIAPICANNLDIHIHRPGRSHNKARRPGLEIGTLSLKKLI